MTSDDISATTTYMMCREEQLCNVSVFQRIHLSSLVVICYCIIFPRHVASYLRCLWTRVKPCPWGSLHSTFWKMHLILMKCYDKIFIMFAVLRMAGCFFSRCSVYRVCMSSRCFWNDLDKLPAALVIIGIIIAFTFHMRYISVNRRLFVWWIWKGWVPMTWDIYDVSEVCSDPMFVWSFISTSEVRYLNVAY